MVGLGSRVKIEETRRTVVQIHLLHPPESLKHLKNNLGPLPF